VRIGRVLDDDRLWDANVGLARNEEWVDACLCDLAMDDLGNARGLCVELAHEGDVGVFDVDFAGDEVCLDLLRIK